MSVESSEVLLTSFADGYLISRAEIVTAINNSQPFDSFQILDTKFALKVDCFIQRRTPFDEESYDLAKAELRWHARSVSSCKNCAGST